MWLVSVRSHTKYAVCSKIFLHAIRGPFQNFFYKQYVVCSKSSITRNTWFVQKVPLHTIRGPFKKLFSFKNIIIFHQQQRTRPLSTHAHICKNDFCTISSQNLLFFKSIMFVTCTNSKWNENYILPHCPSPHTQTQIYKRRFLCNFFKWFFFFPPI